jgi:hypothetical protein
MSYVPKDWFGINITGNSEIFISVPDISKVINIAYIVWFSPGTLASSTTKTGRHDIAEILLKVALSTKIHSFFYIYIYIHGSHKH